MMRTITVILALLPATMFPAAGSAQEPAPWTAEQREEIGKLIKKASVATQKTTPEQQAQMRANGRPVEMLRGEPKFAESKLEQDVYGCVVVSFEILHDGKTDEFEVVRATTPGLFDMLAMRAVMATEFEPPPARSSGPRPRHHKALLVLIPQAPPKKVSLLNDRIVAEREARRSELRTKCEAQAP